MFVKVQVQSMEYLEVKQHIISGHSSFELLMEDVHGTFKWSHRGACEREDH